jgi:hypothetical protein
MIRYLRAFFAFWSDFLIGDRLELFVGPILALLAAWLLVGAGLPGALVGALLFVTVVMIGAFSVALATRR